MAKPQSITSLPEAPEVELRARMIKYSVTMGIRLVCVFLCFFVQGWWLLLPAIGAIVLPYIAVLIANVSMRGPGEPVERPGAVLPYRDGPTLG